MTPVRARAALFVALGCWLAAGCDRVGAPLVDERPSEQVMHGPQSCVPAPMCSEATPPAPIALRAFAPLDPTACTALGEGCTGVRIVNPSARAGDSMRVPRLALERAALAVVSTVPFTLTLEQPALHDVVVELAGPITLRIEGSSEFSEVRVLAQDGAGEPVQAELELERVRGRDMLVGDTSPFPGPVTLTRTELADSQVVADELRLESVRAQGARFEARSLLVTDAELDDTTLAFEAAQLAASSLRWVHVARCGALGVFGGSLAEVQLPACRSAPLRLYGASVSASLIDGDIDADRTSFTRVLFGAAEATTLTAWEGALDAVRFCSASVAARLGEGVEVYCAACESDPALQPEACDAGGPPPELSMNGCAALAELAACEPRPERMRPAPHL